MSSEDDLKRAVDAIIQGLLDKGYVIKKTWECMGRKQALPEPGECNWPDCGCDPHATKVIESLVEQGWGPSST